MFLNQDLSSPFVVVSLHPFLMEEIPSDALDTSTILESVLLLRPGHCSSVSLSPKNLF